MPEQEQQDKKEYYEVIYNTEYGSYKFPISFVEFVFTTHPPHTEIGAKLFREVIAEHFLEHGKEPDPSWEGRYHDVYEKTPFVHGYSFLTIMSYHDGKTYAEKPKKTKYLTRDDEKYYHLTEYEFRWRASPIVIELAKQKDLFTKETSTLRLAKVPEGYGYSIDEYDGMESVNREAPVAHVFEELLKYIDTRNPEDLGTFSKKLVNKEITFYEFMNPPRFNSERDEDN